ncbi:MAG: radical SAM family heme chaperone HemW, partial [Hydrogenovibrio sp.]|nr:radical SAM family heme chaperone HemW [Hydrogenovibrio sp.]
MNFTQPLPLSLYVHYPWCIQKCPYCDFNSHTLGDDQESAYLSAMIRQLEQTLPSVWGRPIQSIFFGGGTPSLISEAGLDRFLSQVRALLGFQPDIEITLEANPGTVDFEKFAGFRQAGINRLSMGVQSFDDQKLDALGRIHSADEAYLAVEAAKKAGFDNFNLDLMFALPNQTLSEAIKDVETAIALAPPHLSHYQLTLEPNTPFYKNPPVLPEDDAAWEMQVECQRTLSEAGYQHYEVSAYAQINRQCVHNVNYWQFGDYIGLGAGAHGKITDPPQAKILRTQMPASPGGYIRMIEEGKMGKVIQVSEEEARFEFMLNALRL